MKENQVDLITQRGPSLGVSSETVWASREVQMAKGDRMLIFSDGVADGSRVLKKLCESLKNTQSNSLGEVIRLVLDVGKSSAVEDDRTVVIVERV